MCVYIGRVVGEVRVFVLGNGVIAVNGLVRAVKAIFKLLYAELFYFSKG